MVGSVSAADGRPGLARRVGFWVLLGLASTAFAEGLFPTTPFDLVTMALVAVPVYLLHAVVLAGVVFRTLVFLSYFAVGLAVGVASLAAVGLALRR